MGLCVRFIANQKGGAAMRVYISMPMIGYGYEDRKGKAATVYMNLLEMGFEPVNPMNNGLDKHSGSEKNKKVNLHNLLNCDAIYLCRGWRKAQECVADRTVAEQCGMMIMEGGAE